MNPLLYRNDAQAENSRNPKILKYSKFVNTLLTLGIIVLVVDAVIGVYHLARFLILALNSWTEFEFINTSNVIVWVVSVILVLAVFGCIRVATTYLGNIVKFVFKIAQSDIVTIILAIAVNGLLLWLNTWLTRMIIGFIEYTNVDSFFSFSNQLSVVVMFIMLAGALLWIPRLGTYGENRLGQFDDN